MARSIHGSYCHKWGLQASASRTSKEISNKNFLRQCSLFLSTYARKSWKQTGRSTVRQLPITLLPPDVTWMRLWKTDAWKRCILEDPSLAPKFWSEVGQHPALLHHPARSVQRYQERAMPLILHGDGASVTQQIGSGSKSCLFVSFKSLLGQSTSCR